MSGCWTIFSDYLCQYCLKLPQDDDSQIKQPLNTNKKLPNNSNHVQSSKRVSSKRYSKMTLVSRPFPWF